MNANKSILRVGYGRGVIGREKVITAAHCLPHIPSNPFGDDVLYRKLLGPIGGPCTVWAECIFVDPLADLAVLACPDNQRLPEEAWYYEELVDEKYSLALTTLPLERKAHTYGDRVMRGFPTWVGKGQLCSLALELFECDLNAISGTLWVDKAQQSIRGGMSGSPIWVNEAVAGIICMSADGSDLDDHRAGDPNPYLAERLPKWLWDELTDDQDG